MNGRCKICGSNSTRSIGRKTGKFIARNFHFEVCTFCGFVAVTDPCTDQETLYGSDYYTGHGADPLVDYAFELEQPNETIRMYEWRGIVQALRLTVGPLSGKRWLDYGCGAGGLVRYVREKTGVDCVGYDTGGFTSRVRAAGIPILCDAELIAGNNRFDIITMIEVIEHVTNPLSLLETISSLITPGGILFLTTGNVARHMKSFLRWTYVVPEIHVSYFSPRSLEIAYRKVGLTSIPSRYNSGWTDIIRFKILKNLRLRRRSRIEASLPWPILSRLADRLLAVSAHPLATKN